MMKKALVSVAILTAFCSCSIEKQEIPAEGANSEKELVTITATQESGPWTRTVLDEDLIHVLWTPEDRINLFYQDQSARFTSINTEENTAVAQFKGQMTVNAVTAGNEDGEMEASYFWGLYPYSEDARYDMGNGTIETSLPWEQTAEKNSFADDLFITIGRSSSWSMPFYNVCSGLRFTVDQEGITAITLRSNGNEPLAGRFVATFDEETERPVVKDVRETYTEIRLVPPEGSPCFYQDTYYYFVTLPGTLESGFTLVLEGLPYDAQVSTTNPVTFKRSRFLSTDLTADRYYADILPLESIDLDIENEGVREYLDRVNYENDLDSYLDSWVKEYTTLGNDSPSPVRFNWKTAAQRTLTVIDLETEYIAFKGDASETTTEVYNLIPGHKYKYVVEGDLSWESYFCTEGNLRMIRANTRNFRDLGGWTGEGGKTLAYAKLYRGAQINASDEELFQTLGIGVDLDLRGNPDGSPGPVFDERVVLWTNIKVYQFMYRTSSGGGGGGGSWSKASVSSEKGYTASLYRQALSYVIDCLSQGKVVYFHCIGGADRTGTLAFLIEALLGVSESDLSKDYELTSFSPNTRLRNDEDSRPFKQLVFYLKTYEGETLQEQVTNWATTGENALSDDEIDRLKLLMLE